MKEAGQKTNISSLLTLPHFVITLNACSRLPSAE